MDVNASYAYWPGDECDAQNLAFHLSGFLGGAPVSQVLPVARRIWAAEFGSADASPRHDGRIRIAITRTATAQQVKHNGQPI